MEVYPEKTADILPLNYWFPCKMTCEEQAQKFLTTGFSLRILVAGERCNITEEYIERGSVFK